MKVTLQIKLGWDKQGGEKLADFRKKYESFKHHVLAMQLKGMLPMSEVRWMVEKIDSPKERILLGPATVLPIGRVEVSDAADQQAGS